MGALSAEHVSIDDFLVWITTQEERFELVDGQIIMMAGASVRHNVVVNNVTVSLTPAAKRNGCRSTTSDTAVRTCPKTIRYPDVVIDCGPPNFDAMMASHPTIIVEVSSPRTAQVDAVVKLDEYRSIASIQAVIQIEPDFVLVSVHRRMDDGRWQTDIYQDLNDTIVLVPIDGTLSLTDIYDSLPVRPRPPVQIVKNTGL